ncbi:hypothetical protein PCA20602_02691 [Pandoraea capi]|uniref:DUF551 domain-containing protein n=1 Tax=Pandoraea capi TaxID=2508286 RepID=A0ABY6W0W5_9BURK|nr:DUF551 domain-containing protein [Pandoraea capi]VVE12190.1 hypothetical protein PCA20602_02691 [Pandoraea capi]
MSPYEPRPEGLNTQPAPPSVVETIAEGSNLNPAPTYAKPAPPPSPHRIGVIDELAKMTRMFGAACADLGLINEALGLDPDDGGAEPILEAIAELKARLPQWITSGQRLPDTDKGDCSRVIVACRRAHNGQTYVFEAFYLNEPEDTNDEDGNPVSLVGWYQAIEHPEFSSFYEPVCEKGDEVTHWMPLPDAPNHEEST